MNALDLGDARIVDAPLAHHLEPAQRYLGVMGDFTERVAARVEECKRLIEEAHMAGSGVRVSWGDLLKKLAECDISALGDKKSAARILREAQKQGAAVAPALPSDRLKKPK